MLFSSGPGQRTDLPLVQDTTSGFFIRSEGDRLIMGYGGEHELDGHNNSLDWAWLESVMEAGHERFPWILDLPMDQRASWAGTYDMSPDHLPFVGRMPGVENWVNVCGFSGHGVMQAPALGEPSPKRSLTVLHTASTWIHCGSSGLCPESRSPRTLSFEPFMIGRVIFDIGGLRHQA